jgi:hypothetical protein
MRVSLEAKFAATKSAPDEQDHCNSDNCQGDQLLPIHGCQDNLNMISRNKSFASGINPRN